MSKMCVNELTQGLQQHGDVCYLRLFSIIMVMLLPLVLFSSPIVAKDDSAGIDDDDEPIARSAPSEPSKKTIDPKKKLEKEAGAVAKELSVLNTKIKPGVRLALSVSTPVAGLDVKSPIIIIHGRIAGPTICITAAIHGDELNGIEVARQISYSLDPATLRGTIITFPVVNMEGFIKQSRYVADRRDLNRFFPGHPEGMAPERIAYRLFNRIVERCDALIDLHTGSYYRSNLPQIRGDLSNEIIAEMVKGFGGITILHSPGVDGMLRVEALKRGVPAVTMEVGGPLRLEPEAVRIGTRSIKNYLAVLGMLPDYQVFDGEQPTFYDSKWLRANASGIFISDVSLGDEVKKGETLGSIIDPVSNNKVTVQSPDNGTILGLGDNQFVAPGYAIYRLGYTKSEEQLQRKAVREKRSEAEEKIKKGKHELQESVK